MYRVEGWRRLECGGVSMQPSILKRGDGIRRQRVLEGQGSHAGEASDRLTRWHSDARWEN
jgi:hypothetical protein